MLLYVSLRLFDSTNRRYSYRSRAQILPREYLLDGNAAFPGPEEAAVAVWTAVNDGKDQINYPTDSVCQKLYDQYQSMNVEEFKICFYDRIFGGAGR